MTDAQIKGFRAELRDHKAALEEKLCKRDGIDVQRSADPADEALLAIERELNVRALDRENFLLALIRSALRRIEEGDYGVCQHCEGGISEKRLAALPWAAYCIHCQERADQMRERPERWAA
jgi:DnaK suppressor protein